ncbi:hypothetical protein SH661x_004231 [Planctomicrobium sp. SH661]|uniref:hypothetical protein n=1 Tax=Planctomicrobium sp. SH661 TaxID=3448124 RepID=UPI003F5C2A53
MQQVETAQAAGVLEQFGAVLVALGGLIVALVQAILPWTPLLLWIAFWLLAVNWRKLYPVLWQGGIFGVILIALMAVMVWAAVAEPEGGSHHLAGLVVDNFAGKFVYVSGLTVIAFLCGTVQLSGACGACCNFDEELEPSVEESHAHH